MSLPAWFYSPYAQTLGWTLVHSLWELALVALLMAAGFLVLRRRSAQARYVLGCGGLLLMCALPAATYFHLLPPPVLHATVSARAQETDSLLQNAGEAQELAPAPRAALDLAPHRAAPATSWQARLRMTLQTYLPDAVLLYCAGALLLALRLAAGYGRLRHTVRRAYPAPPALQAALVALSLKMAVSGTVRLLESAAVEVPTLIGAFRPVILFPVSALTGLSSDQLAALLAHELAHIRRHDYLVNLAQCAIETLLFHHPAVWWLSARVRQEREHCCDEAAIAATTDRVRYAEALASMEALRAPAGLVMAAAGGSLVARIRHILGMPPARTPRRFLTLTAATLFVCVLAGLAYFGCNRSTSPSAAVPATAPAAAWADHGPATTSSIPDSATSHTYDIRYLLPRGPADAREQMVARLFDTLQSSVAPTSWKNHGGTGEIIRQPDDHLTVINTPENLATANQFLAQLFAARAMAVAVECRAFLVSSNFLDDFRLGWVLTIPMDDGAPGEAPAKNASLIDNWTLNMLLQATQLDRRTMSLTGPRISVPNGYAFSTIIDVPHDGQAGAAAHAAVPDFKGVRVSAVPRASADRRFVVLNVLMGRALAAASTAPVLTDLFTEPSDLIPFKDLVILDRPATSASTAPATTNPTERQAGPGGLIHKNIPATTMLSVPDGGSLVVDGGTVAGAGGDYRLLILVRSNLRTGAADDTLFKEAGGMPVDETAPALTRTLTPDADGNIVRVFDARELLVGPDPQEKLPAIPQSVDQWLDANAKQPFGQPHPAEETGDQRQARRLQTLIDQIKSAVAPDSWTDKGGKATIRVFNGQLIVSQTPASQAAILQLWRQWQEDRSLQVAVETHLLLVGDQTLKAMGLEKPAPARPGAPGEVATSSPAPSILLDETHLKAALDVAGKAPDATTLTAPRVILFNKQMGYISLINAQNIVASSTPAKDAAGAPTLTIKTVTSGTIVFLRGTVAPDRKSVDLEFHPWISQLDGIDTFQQPELGKGAFKQLPHVRTTEMSTQGPVPDGNAVVLVLPAWLDHFSIPDQKEIQGWQKSPATEKPAPRNLIMMVRPQIIAHKEIETDLFGPGYDGPASMP